MYRNGVAIERRIWGPFGPQTALTEVFYMSARTVNHLIMSIADGSVWSCALCVFSVSTLNGVSRALVPVHSLLGWKVFFVICTNFNVAKCQNLSTYDNVHLKCTPLDISSTPQSTCMLDWRSFYGRSGLNINNNNNNNNTEDNLYGAVIMT